MISIQQSDAVKWANEYDGPLFHALLCDPPYHLTTIVKRFGKEGSAPAKFGTDGVFARSSKGFMGKVWDGGDIAFQPETWYAFMRVLHPGAFGMAFASSRGWHRLAVAIEDAGFIIHPTIFGWVTGQGFPKSTRVFREGDNSPFCKCGDSRRQWLGHDLSNSVLDGKNKDVDSQSDYQEYPRSDDGQPLREEVPFGDIAPSQDDVRERIRSSEPLNEIRVGNEPSHTPCQVQYSDLPSSQGCSPREQSEIATQENILLNNKLSDISQSVNHKQDTSEDSSYNNYTSGFPHCQECGKPIDVWSGHRYGLQALKPALEPIIVFQKPYEGRPVDCMVETGAGALNIDAGRIPVNPDVDDMLRTVNRKEREAPLWKEGSGFKNENNKLTGVPANGRWPSNFILEDEEAARALDEQSGESRSNIRPPTGKALFDTSGNRSMVWNDNNVMDTTERGHIDFGGASRFFFNVQEQIDESDPVYYCSKASNGERNIGLDGFFEKRTSDCRPNDDGTHGIQSRLHGATTKGRNPHPTLKPIALAKYLATLLLPPEMYAPRRIFVPFAGVASECIGAHQAMWEEIVGVEMEKEYCEIAKARVDYWTSKPIQKEMF